MPFLSDPFLLLGLLFVVTTEQINVIVVIIACRSSGSSRGIIRCILASLSKLFHTRSERLDMIIPTKSMGSIGLGSSSKSLEHSCVCLAWDIPFNIAVLSQELIESLHSCSRFQISKHDACVGDLKSAAADFRSPNMMPV